MGEEIWKIGWEDGMSVGIPGIDEEHKQFILLLNEFSQSIAERVSVAEIKKTLQRIVADAERHFADEEKLLREWHYPDIDQHGNSHAQSMKAMLDIISAAQRNELDPVWINAGLSIKAILIDHHLKEDMKYAEFYRNSHGA